MTGLKTLVYLLPLLLVSCATPLVVHDGVATVTPELGARYAVMEDGYRLPLTRWSPGNGCRALVLALHGLNDYRQAFASTGTFLARRGIQVLAYDQRGFGDSARAGYWHGADRMAADLRTMVRLAGTAYPDCPLFVLGESMGGAVALAAADGLRERVAGFILVAPAVWSRDSMPYYQRAALWLAAHTVPGKRLTGEGLDLKPSDNIDMLRALGRDPRVIKATRVDVLYGMSNLMDRASRVSPDALGNALILYGRHDDIIPPVPTCRWLDLSTLRGNGQWRGILYDDGYHMLTRDLQAAKVLHDIAQWLLSGGRSAQRQHPLSDWCTNEMPYPTAPVRTADHARH